MKENNKNLVPSIEITEEETIRDLDAFSKAVLEGTVKWVGASFNSPDLKPLNEEDLIEKKDG